MIPGSAAYGSWLVWQPLSNYFSSGHLAYLLTSAGYVLFTVLICISGFVNAPSNQGRFSKKQRTVAKITPFFALGIALTGVVLRWV